ncbi:extracellular matrix regulator RemB [Paenibacillus tengchongensis]|uniref:extracellular matrix regulator RemB n=1 Tax=Paenibacillus tengchongensis TaxID=2608684 RepID=UPI00124BEFBC|nr:extracellular matrix/biofilm biosynthesis regulator RemA family protein [Paenibacillus tengchongensis]
MYIHLGGEKVIRSSELIAIFDISIEKSSKVSKQFMVHSHQDKRLERIGDEEAKSIIVTKNMVYYSPISSSTLQKRARMLLEL